MASVRELIGIESGEVERLHQAGICTLDQLLEVGASPHGRLQLADETLLDEQTIKNWVHQADLMRVKGIGPELAHLLCRVGVFTAPKLAYRNVDNLRILLSDANHAKRAMYRLPKALEIQEYVSMAKHLPKLVRH